MICHITTHSAWAAAQASGRYLSPEFEQHGFIHCSTGDQVVLVANAFFRGRLDLLLLVIDEGRLESPVRWEPADETLGRLPGFMENAVFPHVYGPINLGAVVRTIGMDPTDTGSFVLPRPT